MTWWAGWVELRHDDVVCGVFSLENILFNDRQVAGVIDVEAIGRGTRVFDLAVLYSRLRRDQQASALGKTLRSAAEAVEGTKAFAVCLAAEFLGLMVFMLDRRPEWVSSLVSDSARSLERLIS